MNRRRFAIGAAAAAATHTIGNSVSAQSDIPAGAVEAKFLHAVDGEKITVLINGDESEVRFIGVDAPELSVDDNTTECFAVDATTFLSELLVEQDVYLEADVEDKDNKDRLWRYVWATIDGETVLVNELVLAGGFAIVKAEEKNVKYTPRLANAEKEAQAEKLGLWGACESGHQSVPRFGSKELPGEFGETLDASGVAVTLSEIFTTGEYNFSTPKGGYLFLIFQAYFENVGSSDKKGYDAGRFEATDMDTGADHKETFALLDQPLGNGELSYGSYVFGQVCIEIQETATELRIKYQVNGSGGPSLYWLVNL